MGPSHVLVPLDGSPLADDALAHALDTFDCRVTVLNVVTPLDSAMSEGGVLDRSESETRHEAARERADELIEDAKHRAAEADRSVETAIETGDPAETIVAYVESHDVDHVVMGGHGGERNELARRLLGTVATAVVGEAPVTVTVVR
ncbi:universal stress protein [Halorussus halophilus]|uniref:universal stress protein n=1 Tax=Halorussus halophilus TaxID=2650975 RepID=UPI001300F4E7|nr:universal stress protein [Halorussus halophilus]